MWHPLPDTDVKVRFLHTGRSACEPLPGSWSTDADDHKWTQEERALFFAGFERVGEDFRALCVLRPAMPRGESGQRANRPLTRLPERLASRRRKRFLPHLAVGDLVCFYFLSQGRGWQPLRGTPQAVWPKRTPASRSRKCARQPWARAQRRRRSGMRCSLTRARATYPAARILQAHSLRRTCSQVEAHAHPRARGRAVVRGGGFRRRGRAGRRRGRGGGEACGCLAAAVQAPTTRLLASFDRRVGGHRRRLDDALLRCGHVARRCRRGMRAHQRRRHGRSRRRQREQRTRVGGKPTFLPRRYGSRSAHPRGHGGERSQKAVHTPAVRDRWLPAA